MTMLKHFLSGAKKPHFDATYTMTLLCSYMTLNCIVKTSDIQSVTRKMTL